MSQGYFAKICYFSLVLLEYLFLKVTYNNDFSYDRFTTEEEKVAKKIPISCHSNRRDIEIVQRDLTISTVIIVEHNLQEQLTSKNNTSEPHRPQGGGVRGRIF